jgi:hypothetical protein
MPDLMDQYQPAVCGFLRRHQATAGKEYDGFEIDVSGTGGEGRWVLGAQISNHTIDRWLIERPLNWPHIKTLNNPRLRLRSEYRLILNPDTPERRRAFIT